MPQYAVPSVTGLPVAGSPSACRRRVVVVTNLGANSLEYIGPMQVFEEANFVLARAGRADLGYDLEVASTTPGVVFECKGLKVVTDRSYHRVRGPIDTLMFQAVDNEERCLGDPRFLAWVRREAARARRVASICVGTFVLAKAGLLDGRRATTHWVASDDFKRRYPEVQLDPDPIFVKDGNVYTSAGATSGIDMAIALVQEDYGKDLARRIAQLLVMFLKRPGNQAQFSVQLNARVPDEERLEAVQTYVTQNPDADLGVEALAQRAGMSPRNFSRVFAQEVGMTPGRFVELSRLEHARQRLEASGASVTDIATECGYGTPDGLRIAFERHLGVSPRAYRQRFG